jgi:hypothetical protein
MRFDALIRRLMPRENRFQELLARDTENLLAAARVFAEIAAAASLERRRVKAVELKSLEHDGDQITRQIFEALNTTFLTPLDREDIRWIATDLDDILDYLEGVAQHLILFELRESPDALQQFAAILVEMVEEIDRITRLVWDMANQRELHERMVRVSDLENRADALYQTVIADLFKVDGRDPIAILKWKEVYQGLEDACDQCKDYTHIIGNVIAKNS